jgi:hypothetical protein
MTPELRGDWEMAATDAGFDPALVVLYPRPSNGRFGAMHFPPGQWPQLAAFAQTRKARNGFGERWS